LVRRYPLQSLLVGLGLGFLLARRSKDIPKRWSRCPL